MQLDTRFRRLGDLAAGTLVIYRDKTPSASSFSYQISAPPPEWLSRNERQAIVEFAERSKHLSTERQMELALLLSHMIDEQSELDPVQTLKSWAQWILRGQTDAQSTSV